MAYATIADLKLQIGEIDLRQLTDRLEAEAGVMDVNVVQNALNSATSQINSALSARYVVPIPDGDPELVRNCCVLARANLYSWAGNASERVDSDAKTTREWLKLVAKGTYNIIGATLLSTGNLGGSAFVAPPEIYGDSFLSMYA